MNPAFSESQLSGPNIDKLRETAAIEQSLDPGKGSIWAFFFLICSPKNVIFIDLQLFTSGRKAKTLRKHTIKTSHACEDDSTRKTCRCQE